MCFSLSYQITMNGDQNMQYRSVLGADRGRMGFLLAEQVINETLLNGDAFLTTIITNV